MNIKKAYVAIIELLEANKENTVASIFDQAVVLASAKSNRAVGTSFIKDSDGQVLAIHDYYFKRWLPVVGESAVEFGLKAKTATGFNTMCKAGVSNWTKQQAVARKAKEAVLVEVQNGELAPSDIEARMQEIDAARTSIVETELGFDSKEDLMEYLEAEGFSIAA